MSPLQAKGVGVALGGRRILDSVDLRVGAGEMVGVVGANGSGKTTLLRAALGLARRERGTVELAGRPVDRLRADERARLVGYLPQSRDIAWNMPALAVASLGRLDVSPRGQRDRARAALTRVGLSALADRPVFELSGGERARVLLARLLATDAPLLAADEPIAGLDPDAQLLALDLLREEAARGAGVVLTIHDLSLAARRCDRLVVLSSGRSVADGPPLEALQPNILEQAFSLNGRLEETPAGPILIADRKEGRL